MINSEIKHIICNFLILVVSVVVVQIQSSLNVKGPGVFNLREVKIEFQKLLS